MNRKLLRRMTLPLIAACAVLADCSNNTTTTAGPPTAFAVMRFDSTGALDQSFAGAGKGVTTTIITPGLFDFALAAAVQPADNKILVGGSSGLAGSAQIALVRYNTGGSLDTGFGNGGIVKTPAPAGSNSAGVSAIAVQPTDNKIVVAALTFAASTGNTGIALLRYNANGTPDTNFGTQGIVNATIGSGLAGDTCALALQGTNIIVAGASTGGNVILYRYDTNGNLDPTFGPNLNGSTVTPLPGAVSPAIAFQSTGNIILVSGTNNDQAVLRYSANGVLDPTFGSAGIVTTDAGGTDFANAVAVQSDDKIVVAGHAGVNGGTTSDISLVRYNADGTLDKTTFGNPAGIVTTDIGGRFDNAFSVALESPASTTTRILVSGNTGSGGFSQALVLRYNTDGTLDNTFGQPNGFVAPPVFGPSNIASGNAVVMQTGLGIIVAGYD